MILLTALSFALAVVGVSRSPEATFYLLPARAWELLAGALLASYGWNRVLLAPRTAEAAAGAGLLLVLAPCFAYAENTPFPGMAALPPVLGALLLIAAGADAQQRPRVSRLLASPAPVFIGLISYSLYLWHWPLLVFARYSSLEPLSLGTRITLALLSLVLAVLSWWLVETPFRTRRLLAGRRSLMAATTLAYAAMLLAGYSLYQTRGLEARLNPLAKLFVASARKDPHYFQELVPQDVPAKLVRLGPEGQAPQLLVWGDSHAMSVLPVIDVLCHEVQVGAVAATHSMTPPVLGYASRNPASLRDQSLPFNQAVFDHIRSAQIHTVVLVGHWARYTRDQDFVPSLLVPVHGHGWSAR